MDFCSQCKTCHSLSSPSLPRLQLGASLRDSFFLSDLTQRTQQCTTSKDHLRAMRFHTNNLGKLNFLVILPSRKVRPGNMVPTPPTSRLKNSSMVSTCRLSSHPPQVSTLLASPIKLLVLIHQINNLSISSTSKRTVPAKPTKLEAFLTQLLTSHLSSPATTVGAVTTGLRIVQSHEELYLRKLSSSLLFRFLLMR
jgi:hypothetical protein